MLSNCKEYRVSRVTGLDPATLEITFLFPWNRGYQSAVNGTRNRNARIKNGKTCSLLFLNTRGVSE